MSYLQPRLTWATAGTIGFRAAPQEQHAVKHVAKRAARTAPAPAAAAKLAVATLALEENSCPQAGAEAGARFSA